MHGDRIDARLDAIHDDDARRRAWIRVADAGSLRALDCTRCFGCGTVYRRVGEMRGWNGVIEPVEREVECSRCLGTGEEPCVHHPDRPAVARARDGDALCVECAHHIIAELLSEEIVTESAGGGTVYRARAAYLAVRPLEIPYCGKRIGEVWTEACGMDLPILLLADTSEIRGALASVGIYVQPRSGDTLTDSEEGSEEVA